MANSGEIISVYVLTDSENRRIYIGQSNDVERRLTEHNTRARRYTSGCGTWKILLQESYPTRSEAIVREKQLKTSRGRRYIRELMRSSVSWRIAPATRNQATRSGCFGLA